MLRTIRSKLHGFIQSQSLGGVILGVAAIAAMLLANSPWGDWYESFRQIPGEVRVGENWLVLQKPLILWVNDLWMAVFFFLVGLEIKRELFEGELADFRQAILPAAAAVGGMAVPALIYTGINWGDAVALRGWAIPAATDIAFALGILILLGNRVPLSLKVFVTAVAIIDDLGAILVIAFFYTAQLSVQMLLIAAVGTVMLMILNRMRVMAVAPYVLVGLVIWVCVLKSGIHATLAGVITALAIPLTRYDDADEDKNSSPLSRLEHDLHPWVALVVLPMFAFANAGVSLEGVTFATLGQGVPIGIIAGLVFGKTIGVFGVSWAMIRFGGASLPHNASWQQFLGVCVLCGVGFTMSLFIGALAFDGQDPVYGTHVKLGVISGSIIAAWLGTLLLLQRPAAKG